ncbi:hypothetical protein M409DRAFT_65327 [Zasmidium cellare ATCC 36951]|uniref:Pre-mRNA-splicing factor n=1 Tax=Zasmidium cellare ATCC 36951 TaxID=1080233 RepID=A0A6A6CS53_ZASCE|nr:uncharacterized protein M409DRAFT_65327 [Zasmidium cellare ATCC 36951]KAF2169008.1 hypothetical protein M409DRAFT_65327 [Zasmidium cellare ATCC 36951]
MASKISLSLGAKRKGPPPINGVKRPHSSLHDEEDAGAEFGAEEKVSHFDREAGGAIDESRKKKDTGPLVIPKMSNRDWREAANQRKRQKSALPTHGNDVNMEEKMRAVEAADAAKKPQFGLNTYKRAEENGDYEMAENGHATDQNGHANGEEAEPPRQKTDDELAMDALLGKTTTNKSLTIPAAEGTMTEGDAFQHDYTSAPDAATLDDYARVPVEQFGAALLRGMGWKDGEGIGSQRGKKLPKDINKLPERRANLLGIGAKEDAALAQEMGAWGKGAKGGKEIKIYNPVLLRDKKTGKMYTEEELQKKREQDERKKYEDEFERKEKDKERRRRRDESEERDSRDRRREKERNAGRDHDHRRERDSDRRRHDEESDEEYYRRKEKERRRRKDRERENDDYDRERSRRHKDRDDRDRHHDRDRDRRR